MSVGLKAAEGLRQATSVLVDPTGGEHTVLGAER